MVKSYTGTNVTMLVVSWNTASFAIACTLKVYRIQLLSELNIQGLWTSQDPTGYESYLLGTIVSLVQMGAATNVRLHFGRSFLYWERTEIRTWIEFLI